MKTKKLFLMIPFLLLIMGMGGCEENKEYNNVPYGACDCKEKKQSNLNFTKEKTILYIVSSQEESKLLNEINQHGGDYSYIIYNKETDKATMYHVVESVMQVYRICNYPEFAKNWNISDKGQKVYFEGNTYVSCEELGGLNISYFDYILTTLIKKKS